MEIGIRLKERRQLAQLTQEELGDRCDLTKGYISQLENDLVSPSIETLRSILTSLGSNLTDFFADEDDEKVVFEGAEHFEKVTKECSTKWLVPSSQKNVMEPILFSLKAGKKSDEDLPHDGEEFGYVLSGAIRLVLGKKSYEVSAGSTFYFRANKKHFIENVGDKVVARVLWVSSPPNF